MQTISQIKYLRAAVNADKLRGRRIALVPTMGNLHEGHLQLVRRAHEVAGIVVVSIFVNPLQFGENEDFDSYPRSFAQDQEKLAAENVHYLFTPDIKEIYPHGQENHTRLCMGELGKRFCGISRPTHFDGACTIVNKLFNLVQPTSAIFGEKDFQQLALIKKMTRDMGLPIDIIGVPTARAYDGLALSSRNQYLTQTDRVRAPLFYESLKQAKHEIIDGKNIQTIRQNTIKHLEENGFIIDYFDIVKKDLSTYSNTTYSKTEELVILSAVYLGKTRLIDNIAIK